jgi:hypothetical protein
LSRSWTIHSFLPGVATKESWKQNDAFSGCSLQPACRTRIPIENPARIFPGTTSMDFPVAVFCLAVQQVLNLHRKKKTNARNKVG